LSDTIASLAPGASVTYTLTVQISASATGSLVNTATVSQADDTTPGNNYATDTDTLTPQANLSVTKTDGTTTAVPGTSTTYTIVVSNAGPSTATNVSVSDPVPAGVTSATWSGNGQSNVSGALSDTIASLAPGASVTYTLTVQISPSATGSLVNTVTISAASDTTPGNNSATDTDTLTPQANVSVTKTDGTTTAVPGTSTTYTIVVSNAGPSTATNVSVSDPLAAGVTSASWTGTNGHSGTGALSDTIASLAPGASVTYTNTVQIGPGATGNLVNTTTINAASDTTPGNNSASDTDTLTPQADLSITKSGPASVIAGNSITYTLIVHNGGPSNVPSFTVTDALPSGLSGAQYCTYTGATPCTILSAYSSPLTGLGPLATGNDLKVKIVATVNSSVADGATLNNQASVSSPTFDPDTSNNTSNQVTTTVSRSADLSITKSGPASVIAGNSITYTLTVHNAGPSDVATFTVTDALPSGLSGAQYCTYSPPATDCVATTSYSGSIGGLGPLAAGNDLKVKIVAMVSTSLVSTTISNQASVSSATTDPIGSNNTSAAVQTYVAKRPTTLTYTGASNGQYSDPAGLKATLKDTATNDPVANATVTFVVGTQTMTAVTDANGVASTDDAVVNRLNQPAGSKTLTVSSTGTTLYAAPANVNTTYQVNAEDASVYDFTPPSVTVATAGGTASTTIGMTVAEASDGYPSGAVAPTNGLQKAPVSLALSPVGSGSPATCPTATPTATSPTATASCGPITLAVNVYEIDATILASPAIGGAVAGTYFTGTGVGVITVMDPSLGFTTGGGWFNYTDPSNAANNAKVNFGFNAKILKSGQVQGSVLTIFKRSNGNYIVKSNSMGGLAISKLGTSTHYSASITGKATYSVPVTDPKLVTPSCTDWKCGNYTFTVYVEDLNEPGSGSDRYWIQVKDPSTAPVVVPKASINGTTFTTGTQATNWAQTIIGGNIQVPQPQGQ
jgi:uncharacterized repeat protein (TIGR01451 family)